MSAFRGGIEVGAVSAYPGNPRGREVRRGRRVRNRVSCRLRGARLVVVPPNEPLPSSEVGSRSGSVWEPQAEPTAGSGHVRAALSGPSLHRQSRALSGMGQRDLASSGGSPKRSPTAHTLERAAHPHRHGTTPSSRHESTSVLHYSAHGLVSARGEQDANKESHSCQNSSSISSPRWTVTVPARAGRAIGGSRDPSISPRWRRTRRLATCS